MKHLILGAGNLGKDLLLEVNGQRAGSPLLLSTSRGFDFLVSMPICKRLDLSSFDVIWCAVGGGSVAEAKTDAARMWSLLVDLPFELIRTASPHTHIVVMSSDYAADEMNPRRRDRENRAPRSEYARMKVSMERLLRSYNRPRTSIVRCGSLYGVHKPRQTFPGKVLQRFSEGGLLRFPSNLVTPTPSRWLAFMLLNHFDDLFSDQGTTLHHCAPYGNLSVREWARLVLDGIREPDDFDTEIFFDEERPLISQLECSFSNRIHGWLDLWTVYYRAHWFEGDRLRAQVY